METPVEELTRGTLFAERYEIIEELGKGGMGKVYRVYDKKIKGEVALKLIKPEVAADEKTIERFRNELKVAREISHRNVCRMFHLGEEKGAHYITMEYVPGEDLKSLIRRVRRLDIGTAISISKQVCEGLTEAHRLGVVHRDLKPSNIMIDKEGNARIMDFGIARSLKAKGITGIGIMVGTPEYISPEQAEAKEVDHRSDIYSLGVIIYEMVTGQLPFEGKTALSVAMMHKNEIPKDPGELNAQISKGFSRLILKCMEKEKEKRYQSAEELLNNIEKIKSPIAETIRVSEWKNSIAVLPFTNMSADPEQDYFCDGMAEELINALTQIKGLRVVARTSAFSFKGKDVDIEEIGRKLKVDKVLEGSVRKAGDRLRITAQLINVEDGYHLWSERYDREIEDIFAIQDEVTLAIIDKLKVELLGEEKAKLVKRYTENLEAYNLYLKGRYFWNKRTGEGFKKAIKCFQEAIENDPLYASAYSGLADSFCAYSFYGFIAPRDAFARAKPAAQMAVEIDDTLAEAHASFSYVSMFYDWDWPAAESSLRRAIELNPGYAYAHHYYAAYLAIMGRFEESISEMKQAVELDPLSIRLQAELGNYLRWSGRIDEALEQLQKTLEMDPNFGIAHLHIGLIYALKERYDKAIAAFQKAIELLGGSPLAIGELGYLYAKSGQKDKAEKMLHELEEMSKERYVPPVSIAHIYAELGEVDKALEWGEKAYEEHDTQMPLLKTWPEYENLRSDPRFKVLLRKIGLND